jgi:hypothetical protein
MYLLAFCTSSFENFLLNSFAHFFIGVLILLWLNFLFPVGSGSSPLSDELLAKIFSHSVGCLLSLVIVSFCWAEAL